MFSLGGTDVGGIVLMNFIFRYTVVVSRSPGSIDGFGSGVSLLLRCLCLM